MLGIEINGNQHYTVDGNLKDYYQERSNLIQASGWKLFEYHYSIVYNDKMVDQIVEDIINEKQICNYTVNYSKVINYSKSRKTKKEYFCSCGNKIVYSSKQCTACATLKSRRFEITKEELEKLVWEHPTTTIAKIYNVSDNAIGKRCKLFGIVKPGPGYWAKKKFGYV